MTTLRFGRYARGLAAVGSDTLVVGEIEEFFVCHRNDWRASRSVFLPDGWNVAAVASAAGLVVAVERRTNTAAGVWDIDHWSSPTYAKISEGVRQLPGPPAPPTRPRRGGARRGPTGSLALAPDGTWLAVRHGQRLDVVHPRTWEPLASCEPEAALRMLPSPDGTRLLLLLTRRRARMLDTATWQVDAGFGTVEGAERWEDIAWSPDSSMLATVANDRAVRVHDSRDWRVLAEFPVDGELSAITWVTSERARGGGWARRVLAGLHAGGGALEMAQRRLQGAGVGARPVWGTC
ncbi:hypothetical protein [Actinokineospora diospyrosa]|uniref:WD40 repeat protein n=1 Tax=Actinokineospora diospyrosa TaxID=103728 RepID=A0ABT1IKZ0_9PSEU|nr:hypothetical protein [Actinokineospora diospyrosa]MCP2272881.1 hypothetical protein [Actinokineospora diospyrosa]